MDASLNNDPFSNTNQPLPIIIAPEEVDWDDDNHIIMDNDNNNPTTTWHHPEFIQTIPTATNNPVITIHSDPDDDARFEQGEYQMLAGFENDDDDDDHFIIHDHPANQLLHHLEHEYLSTITKPTISTPKIPISSPTKYTPSPHELTELILDDVESRLELLEDLFETWILRKQQESNHNILQQSFNQDYIEELIVAARSLHVPEEWKVLKS
jgi:hypothetical protein